jgi:hypothetical protein
MVGAMPSSPTGASVDVRPDFPSLVAKRAIGWLLLTAFVMACGSYKDRIDDRIDDSTAGGESDLAAPQPAPAETPSAGSSVLHLPVAESCDDQLQQLADCLYDVVTVLQAEPDTEEPLGRFIARAIATRHAVPNRCEGLDVSADTGRIQRSGHDIVFTRSAGSLDHFADGRTARRIDYTIEVQGCPSAARPRSSMCWAVLEGDGRTCSPALSAQSSSVILRTD